MKESYRKDPASHPDPESCGGGREAAGEALTGAHAGQPLSCEITLSGVPTLSTHAEGSTTGGATGEPSVEPAQSKTLRMRGNSSHGNREIPQAPVVDGSAGPTTRICSRLNAGFDASDNTGGELAPCRESHGT